MTDRSDEEVMRADAAWAASGDERRELVALLTSMRVLRGDLVAFLKAAEEQRERAEKQRKRDRIRSWTAVITAAVALLALVFVLFERVERRDDFCAGRDALRATIINAATEGGGGGGLQFDGSPLFDALDQATKDYLLGHLDPQVNAAPSPSDGEMPEWAQKALDDAPACS